MDVAGWPPDLCEFEKWLASSRAEARDRVPALLDLPGYTIVELLENDPALCTAGMVDALLEGARDVRERHPLRAFELAAAVVVWLLPRLQVPAGMTGAVPQLSGMAFLEFARAMRDIGGPGDGRDAVGRAREYFMQVPLSDWLLATADLVEAPLLHEAGQREAALLMIRTAAEVFDLHGDDAHLVDARMTEAAMLDDAGEHAAATRVWQSIVDAGQQRGNPVLLARADARMGAFRLRRERPAEAVPFLASAIRTFVAAGLVREAAETRWYLAEALDDCGGVRRQEAISEYHVLRAELLAVGRRREAAQVSVSVLGLLLDAGRRAELPSVTAKLVATFESVFPGNALRAFIWLHERADAGMLEHDNLLRVFWYFEELARKPDLVFEPPR